MNKILVVAGPTAVGKTKYAIALAKAFDGEIVSCDSMQLYRLMNIGSAKPTAEELAQAKHYLVDEIDPREPFSVAEYQKRAKSAIKKILEKGKLPIISGGTGLYLNSILYEMDFSTPPGDPAYRRELEELAEKQGKAAVHNLLKEKDPAAADRIHPNNTKKIIRALEAVAQNGSGIRPFSEACMPNPDYDPILIGLTRNRDELYSRINKRVELLIEQGLPEEVKALSDMGLTENHISMKGIGYKELFGYFRGEYSLSRAIEKIQQNTRNYAKRQLTWFKRYDKIVWFNLSDYSDDNTAIEDIILWLKTKQ